MHDGLNRYPRILSLGEVARLSNARSDPGTVQIVYENSVGRSVHKLKHRWILKPTLLQPTTGTDCCFSSHLLCWGLVSYEHFHDEQLEFDVIPVFMGSHCLNFYVTPVLAGAHLEYCP